MEETCLGHARVRAATVPFYTAGHKKSQLITGSIARSTTCRHLIYSEADFEFFAPQGRRVAPMVPSFVQNFTHIGAAVRV